MGHCSIGCTSTKALVAHVLFFFIFLIHKEEKNQKTLNILSQEFSRLLLFTCFILLSRLLDQNIITYQRLLKSIVYKQNIYKIEVL